METGAQKGKPLGRRHGNEAKNWKRGGNEDSGVIDVWKRNRGLFRYPTFRSRLRFLPAGRQSDSVRSFSHASSRFLNNHGLTGASGAVKILHFGIRQISISADCITCPLLPLQWLSGDHQFPQKPINYGRQTACLRRLRPSHFITYAHRSWALVEGHIALQPANPWCPKPGDLFTLALAGGSGPQRDADHGSGDRRKWAAFGFHPGAVFEGEESNIEGIFTTQSDTASNIQAPR